MGLCELCGLLAFVWRRGRRHVKEGKERLLCFGLLRFGRLANVTQAFANLDGPPFYNAWAYMLHLRGALFMMVLALAPKMMV